MPGLAARSVNASFVRVFMYLEDNQMAGKKASGQAVLLPVRMYTGSLFYRFCANVTLIESRYK
ncbi:MAG: hypothetical protein EA364_15955 [Balneolaceae bacterium]|nr:MAG: hypothetical protein EA364_15955 [Balneolaceae bacterium]